MLQRPHYFNGHISRGFMAIYSSRVIAGISSALLGLFLPIFLYELFDLSLRMVLLYFLLDYSIYLFAVAPGAKFALNKLGIKGAIVISVVWGVLYYLMFYFIAKVNGSAASILAERGNYVIGLLGLTIFFINLQRCLYWAPVHTDLSKFTDKENRGKELSLLEASLIAFNAVIPAFAGWLLVSYGYDVLFVISVFTFFLSIVPLLNLPETEEKFSWTISETWREFFSAKRRRTVLAFMGDGAENVASGIIWPIFIWEILKGNYWQVGALSSLIVITSVVLQLFVGRFADTGRKEKILKYGTVLYSLGWIVKMFIATAFQIFVVSTYHNMTRIFTRTPFDAMIYERAADQGHYVDEYTVIHEMALMAGRVVVIGLMLVLIPFFGVGLTFVLAALSTLLMNLLIDEKIVDRQNRIARI